MIEFKLTVLVEDNPEWESLVCSDYMYSWSVPARDVLSVVCTDVDSVVLTIYDLHEKGITVRFDGVISSGGSVDPSVINACELKIDRQIHNEMLCSIEGFLIDVAHDHALIKEKLVYCTNSLEHIRPFFEMNPIYILTQLCHTVGRLDLLQGIEKPTPTIH